MVAENTGDYSTATRMLSSVPDQVTQQPEAIAALARSDYHLDQRENARTTLKALSSHAAGPTGIFLGAQIADEMHDYETAEQLLLSIQTTFPDKARLEYAVALVLYHEGHFADSRESLLSLVASGQTSGEIYNLLGWSYQKQGLEKEAAQALVDGTRIAPLDETNYNDLVKIFLAQTRLPSALDAAKAAVARFPSSARAYELKGRVEAQMGQSRDAIESYTRASRLNPASIDSLLGLADAQYAAGLTKESSASYERGVRQFSKDASFPLHYAVMLVKESEAGNATAGIRAHQLLRSSLKLDPSIAQTHYQLGNLALRNRRTMEAVKYLEGGHTRSPKYGSTLCLGASISPIAKNFGRFARDGRIQQAERGSGAS